MGTISFVGLYYENECWRCEGSGFHINPIHTEIPPPPCPHCKGDGKVWRRLHYTHARTYEEALKKLLPRLSQWVSLNMETKWVLAWKDREGKFHSVSDVTKAVRYRWNKINEKRLKKFKKSQDIK